MTDPVPAAALGLPAVPAFDRRAFLATLAAAGVLTGETVAAAPQGAVEHPDAELIELAAFLQAAVERARAADHLSADLRTTFVLPPLPEACYWVKQDFLHWTGFCFDRHAGEPRKAYCGSTMDRFRELVDNWKYSQNPTHPSDAARVRASEIFEAHDAWQLEVKTAEDEAGITAAEETLTRENTLADTLVCRIPNIAARTPAGVAAKAIAIRAWWGHDRDGLTKFLRSRMDDPLADPWEAVAISMALDAERVCAAPSSAPVAA